MKNKGLMYTVIALGVVLVGFLVFQAFGSSKSSNQKMENNNEKVYTVGVLQFVSHPALDQIYEGVKEGLKKEGYEEGKNLKINFQNGQADQSKLDTMSKQLISDDADALVGIATPAAQALANSTTTIPIVLGAVTDPKGAGLVKSNEKPGGNITGVSDQPPVASIIQLAHKLIPTGKKVGLLYSSSEMNSKFQTGQAEAEAKKLGLAVERKAVTSTNEVAQAVQVLSQSVDFIFIPNDNTIANAMETVNQEADKNNVPVFPSVDTMVEQGGLATIGINQKELGIKTGEMAAAILAGKSKPEDTAVYTFTKGDTIINKDQLAKFNLTLPTDLKENAKLVQTAKGDKK
ncbi:ABC transporter substrate-binding protein [Enterococcus saigonensis]|uniref:ABC transporter substrate-binding protein n=1 Tax=Enterococcus saigonensis TaxID=1805431 RepID=A0A679IKE7_9ENTE|nr:tryptophan ABC transporter substrate-binding protein [Enterococcus saigonensis]BCA85736.1 ABC transporter substrate-binding protein [Enterococcus saigonensis]